MNPSQRVADIFKRLRRISIRKAIPTIKGLPIIPAVILLVFVICGLFGKWIAPHDPVKINLDDTLIPPFWQEGGSTKYILGTDGMGRDMLSRLIFGANVSLQVGFTVIVFSGFLGTVVALLSGYLGGWVDIILMRVVDIFLSLPAIVFSIALAALMGPSKKNLIFILVLVMWSPYARILRGAVLRIKNDDFVDLAIVAGASKARIMFRHIFPNIFNTLVVLATLQLGQVIIAESSLSYMGLGVPPPEPAWGTMIFDGTKQLLMHWWPATIPGLAIVLVVLSGNLFGDWLRVRLDPKFRQL